MRNTIIILFIGFCFVAAGWRCREAHRPPVVKVVPQKEIMSIRELQEFLNSQGKPRYYCGEVDGRLGAKTRKAWDNYICDRYARKEFEQ